MFDTYAANRRRFLANTSRGCGSLALASMLHADGLLGGDASAPDDKPHHTPKAKSVIWLFMVGGASHMESFDPKPALNEYAGKTIAETPFKEVLESPYLENERIVVPDANGLIRTEIYPLQIGYRKHGESGLEISDWFPHVARLCFGAFAVGQGALDDVDQFVQVEWLRQIFVRADLRGLQRGHHRVLRAHDDDLELGPYALDPRQQVEPVLIGHDDVGNHEVTGPALDPAPQRRCMARGVNLVAQAAQRLSQHGSNGAIVIRNEYGRRCHGRSFYASSASAGDAGSMIRNVVCPGSDSNSTTPP